MLNDAQSEYWFYIAQHDIDDALILIEHHGHADIIIYHLHQAVEKYLKGRILQAGVEFPYTHDLERLFLVLIEIVPKYAEIKKSIIKLHSYNKWLRYPKSDELKNHDLMRAKEDFDIIMKELREEPNEKL